MKIFFLILGISIGVSGGLYAETIRVKVKREVPAQQEYYRMGSSGVEKVRVYSKGTVVEKYTYDKTRGIVKERVYDGKVGSTHRRK
jgi:hypothetical protein